MSGPEARCYACAEDAIDRCEGCNRPVCTNHALADESMCVHVCEPCADGHDREATS